MSIEFTLSTKPKTKNQFKIYRFLFKDEAYVGLSTETKIIYSFLCRNQEADTENNDIVYSVKELKRLTKLPASIIKNSKKELLDHNLIALSENDNNFIRILSVNTESMGYYSVPDFINNTLFKALNWSEVVLYAIYRDRYIYAAKYNDKSSKFVDDLGIPFALFKTSEIIKSLKITEETLNNHHDNLIRNRLISLYDGVKGYYRIYVMEPKELSSNTIVLGERKKDEITKNLPPTLASLIKKNSEEEVEFLTNSILKDIDFYNDLVSNKTDLIDIAQSEPSFLSLIHSIKFIEHDKNINMLDFTEVIDYYISVFCGRLNENNNDSKEVKQYMLSEEDANSIFDKAEDDIISLRNQSLEDSLLSLVKSWATKNKEQYEINKQIVINGIALLNGNIMPRTITDYLLTLDGEDFEKIIRDLSFAVDLYITEYGGKTNSFTISFNKIAPRLLHGLKLYKFVTLNKEIDWNTPGIQNYLFIYHQIENSYKENHSKSEIPFTEKDILKAANEVKEASVFF